jgi:tyrosinase
MVPSGSFLRAAVTVLGSLLLLFTAQSSADLVSDLQNKGRPAIDAQLAKSTTCTKDKLTVRKEW